MSTPDSPIPQACMADVPHAVIDHRTVDAAIRLLDRGNGIHLDRAHRRGLPEQQKESDMTTAISHERSPYERIGRHRSNRLRTLSLLDLENLTGGDIKPTIVHDTWERFKHVIDARYDDHHTVAVSQRHAATAFFALPSNIRRVIGANSPDGADIALLNCIDIDWAAENFGQVVIGSGDHIFALLAKRLRHTGLRTIQVTGIGRCSADLYRACDEHRTLSGSNSRGAPRLQPPIA